MSDPGSSGDTVAPAVVGTGLVALDQIHVGPHDILIEELGGSCGNVIISLAMLGHAVAPLLRLGDDEVGTRLVRDLAAAGADTSLVSRDGRTKSPTIIELLDPASASHRFFTACPKTGEPLGSYEPINRQDLDAARDRLSRCAVFYADRLSDAICDAMEIASDAGAIVHFEPSQVADDRLFERALATAHLVKYSDDRLPASVAKRLRPSSFGIVTAGAMGLRLSHAGSVIDVPATNAERIVDTCGSGDMVTIGILDAIITAGVPRASHLAIETVLPGLRRGQRLASANCAYVGARGVFRERGPSGAIDALNAR